MLNCIHVAALRTKFADLKEGWKGYLSIQLGDSEFEGKKSTLKFLPIYYLVGISLEIFSGF
jgi:hypothetical protein